MDTEKRFTSNELFNFAEFCMQQLVRIPPKNPGDFSTITGESLYKIRRILDERKDAHIKAIKERNEVQARVNTLKKELEELRDKENRIKNYLTELQSIKEQQLHLQDQIGKLKLNLFRNII